MGRHVGAGPADPVYIVNEYLPQAAPILSTTAWTPSGFRTTDAVIKDAAGVFAGILVTATDAGGDIDVIVYDSPTSDTSGDIAVARVTITTTTALTQGSFGDLSGPGIVISKGIWVDVVTGDCQFIAFYK